MIDSLVQMNKNILNIQEKGMFLKKKNRKGVRSMFGEYVFIYLFAYYNKLYLLSAYCVTNPGEVLHMQCLIESIQPLKEMMTRNIPSLRMRNMRQSEVLPMTHMVGKWQGWDSDGNLVPSLWLS